MQAYHRHTYILVPALEAKNARSAVPTLRLWDISFASVFMVINDIRERFVWLEAKGDECAVCISDISPPRERRFLITLISGGREGEREGEE
jgi:hypothetical protein